MFYVIAPIVIIAIIVTAYVFGYLDGHYDCKTSTIDNVHDFYEEHMDKLPKDPMLIWGLYDEIPASEKQFGRDNELIRFIFKRYKRANGEENKNERNDISR